MLKLPEGTCDVLHKAATAWSAGHDDWKVVHPRDYHLTLQFIGRDLNPEKIASSICGVAMFAFSDDRAPQHLRLTGAFGAQITKKGRYLVARAMMDPLAIARGQLRQFLRNMEVVPKDSFEFRPHVTLAEAPPSARVPGALPDPLSPFSVEYQELVVKYGPYRMTMQLAKKG